MKKQNENTTQNPPPGGANQSEPPVVMGGSNTRASENPFDTSGGSDTQRLQAENEQLKTTIRLQQAHRQITGELARAGARSPELLFDAIKGELMFTVDGKLENPKGLIDDITARFPEQFGFDQPASIDAGAGTGGGNILTREALAKMKPAEIARLDWADVRRVLAGN